MSRKTQKSISFKYTPTHKLPKLGKIKTEWDLKKLYYKSEKDPKIEKDIAKTERAYTRFAEKYRRKNFVSTPIKLLDALSEYDRLNNLMGHAPAHYFFYRKELDALDQTAEKLLNLLEQRLTKLGNKLIFFEIQIGKIPKKKQKKYLNDKRLKKYHFYLRGVFKDASHMLSESEERILSLKSQTSRGMWIAGTDKILNQRTITFKGEEVPINGALMKYMDLPKKDRHVMWNKTAAVLEEVAPIAENELNALITDKKINDELRGYTKPYSATVKSYDHTEKSVESLIEAVTTKGYKLAHDFYRVKKKYFGATLLFIDRDDFNGTLPEISFKTSVTICRDAFYAFNNIYGEIFDEMLTNGQIDVYPKKGKGGGAFCSSGTNVPTLVFLNHNNGLSGLRTLAHEMGHAIHAYRSKKQPKLYQGHSIATAETASTFFEAVVGRKMLDLLPESERTNFLNTLISDNLKTMVMCIARFNIELEMHETVRREGSMSWQDMRALYIKHMKKYVGPAIDVDLRDGLHFVSKPHYRMNFYQYTYSFGNIASSIMYKRYQADHKYASAIDTFLCAGEHASVDDIFKSIGINTARKEVFLEGLSILEDDINAFKRLVKAKK